MFESIEDTSARLYAMTGYTTEEIYDMMMNSVNKMNTKAKEELENIITRPIPEPLSLAECFEECNNKILNLQIEISILEEKRKRCKNYLELKQIDRNLNILKFRKGKGSK